MDGIKLNIGKRITGIRLVIATGTHSVNQYKVMTIKMKPKSAAFTTKDH